ncbi:MAG: hypothetical protein CVT90_02590, partial [Candidatus Altiarchaeales archaeon HGW-Altiarchaeales-3]
MKMNRPDADALTNDKYFFGYSQGCIAGDYSESDCILEHFVVKNPTGAFAFIGNSRFGLADEDKTTNGPSQFYHRKFYDAIFGKKITNIGRANQYSKESLAGMINSHTGGMRWVYYELNLLGDPETPLHINCSAFNPVADCKNLTVCKNGTCDFTRIDEATGSVCPGYGVDITDNEIYNETISLFGNNITLNCNNAQLIGNGEGIGIHILSSDNSKVENCIIKNYATGLLLSYSTKVTLHNNSMENNTYNFDIQTTEISHYIHDIDTTNKVNGKRMYYLVNEQNAKIDNAGFIALISCDNITVSNSTLTNNGYGAIIINSSSSKLMNNDLSQNRYGIFTDYSSSYIEIINNHLTNMSYAGIYIKNSNSINMSDNEINGANNAIEGVYIKNSAGNTIFNNIMDSNRNNGIILVNSSGNELIDNEITNNYDGLWIYGSSNDNTISDNTIKFNDKRGIGVESLSVNNTIIGNIIEYNGDIGVWFLTNDSTNNTLNFNIICDNPIDINDADNNSGNNNTCDTTQNYNDSQHSAAGCTFLCGYVIINHSSGISVVLTGNESVDLTSERQIGIRDVSIKNATTNNTICKVKINFTGSDPDFGNVTAETGINNGKGYGICHFGNIPEAQKVPGSYKTIYVAAVINSGNVCLLNQTNPTASGTLDASVNEGVCTAAGGEWITGLTASGGFY